MVPFTHEKTMVFFKKTPTNQNDLSGLIKGWNRTYELTIAAGISLLLSNLSII